ncbi:TetR/AcrR family transcriptional regulator [Glacieibacterium sp.]|uniref:TetR/AcrR family transcriptional regulator n=1 Tax=Glacieibacterium sp. TaxID=2860237 RepID=UPI003AFF61B0
MATRALDQATGPRGDTRSRRYDPAETRLRVLAAANMLFSTKGFAATGTADIAREADVSEGSIFYHFGSKQNLLVELGRRYGEQMIEAIQQGDALEDLEPGIIIPRVFEFCRTNSMWEAVAVVAPQSGCDIARAKHDKSGDAEPFYHAAKTTTTAWIIKQMTVAFARRGITDINIPLAGSFTHHVVGDAIEAIMNADNDADRAAIEAETVRFVRAACGYIGPVKAAGGA